MGYQTHDDDKVGERRHERKQGLDRPNVLTFTNKRSNVNFFLGKNKVLLLPVCVFYIR